MDASSAPQASTQRPFPQARRGGKAAAPARRQYGRPNFFVGFRITNPAIITGIQRLQQRIAARFPEVECCNIDARTLHVTLCTLHLKTEEDIQQAVRIVQEHSYKNGLPVFGDDAPSFDFRGVDFFGSNFILYSPLDVESRFYETLEELAETLFRVFDALELTTGPFKKPYTPHITIWKTTKHITLVKRLNKARGYLVEYELGDYLQESEPEQFGTESPTSIELLSMREKEEDGYYKVYESARLVLPERPSDDQHDEATAKLEESTLADSTP